MSQENKRLTEVKEVLARSLDEVEDASLKFDQVKQSVTAEEIDLRMSPNPIRDIMVLAEIIHNTSRDIMLAVLEIHINLMPELTRARKIGSDESYESKKNIVIETNARLRQLNAAVAHPSTGEPCILYAVASRDGYGRYVLENRVTKKRSGAYTTLLDLLPVKLVPDVPRKEGVITRRKKKPQ